MKANLALGARLAGTEQLPDGLEKVTDGDGVSLQLPFELGRLGRQLAVRRQQLAQLHEGPDNSDGHHHRPRAAQHARQHGDALLR